MNETSLSDKMNQKANHFDEIARSLGVKPHQVESTARLIEDGATIPFIARYRKEATGSLDEVAITGIRDQLVRRAELEKRRASVIESLHQRQQLTEALHVELLGAASLNELEDIYLPFRPKRRTRAMIARERGLEPLAEALFRQDGKPVSIEDFIAPDKGITTREDALAGARDIIAERISEDSPTRAALRILFRQQAVIKSSVVEKNREAAAKFRDYFDWQEPVKKIAGHRLLAMFRGDEAKMLSVSIHPDETSALTIITRRHLKGPEHTDVRLAIEDGYRRLLAPSLENELRNELKEGADREAISVFADNLRQLLLAPPLGQKRVLALDPGFRTGAKLVCLDGQGKLLHTDTIYPTLGRKQQEQAGETVRELVDRHAIEAIAIGNGTASRETESFVKQLELGPGVIVTLVNEDGASIYSASETARAEFPELDLTVRGAISIGRRLQDPLAELVKIDPKSIGVGQYQHDVNQTALRASLDEVVSSCVNSVGVELNTASAHLLTNVSGLGPVLAANIVAYRDANGPFKTRRQLLKVPRLGARAFEQAAGFLRINGGEHPLDASAVHPERYGLVEGMATDSGLSLTDLIRSEASRQTIRLERYLSDQVGMPTLLDIMAELAKPGRDPRRRFEQFAFADGINSVEDLTPGMVIPAIITNVTKFGAFADIGVHQDGLIHISQLADRFVKDPAEVVKVRQQVMVRVIEIDTARRRISLSMKGLVTNPG